MVAVIPLPEKALISGKWAVLVSKFGRFKLLQIVQGHRLHWARLMMC